MSIFNEILQKINDISSGYEDAMKKELQSGLDALDKFKEEYISAKTKARNATQKNKDLTTLQSINEDEDDTAKPIGDKVKENTIAETITKQLQEVNKNAVNIPSDKQRRSKKRSREDVTEPSSPEQDTRRPKRNASVRAQNVISKQVNVNLSSKMRREEPNEGDEKRSSRRKDKPEDNKENLPIVQVKQEKISLPQEPMDYEILPVNIKQEPSNDDIAMPPPMAPAPKTRGRHVREKGRETVDESIEEETSGRKRSTRNTKQNDSIAPLSQPRGRAGAKEKETEKADESSEDEGSSRRRTTRKTKKNNGSMAPPTVPAPRSTRESSRKNASVQEDVPPQESRPKRTRAKKKASEVPPSEADKGTTQENIPVSPTIKPRPKRTRRNQKATEKEEPENPIVNDTKNKAETISAKEERISLPPQPVSSPILQKDVRNNQNSEEIKIIDNDLVIKDHVNLEETQVIVMSQEANVTVNICNGDMDKTVILPNGKYNHTPCSPKLKSAMDETVVIQTFNRETIVLEKDPPKVMDATVVISKDAETKNITDDNSLLTDDNSDEDFNTPTREEASKAQPASAVKEKVQQFEELATRVTRTKTRAMAKKEEPEQNVTPPDKIGKAVLSAETLTKMNNLIFNKQPSKIPSSASKAQMNIVTTVKSFLPSSTSKINTSNKTKDEESLLKKEKEDARKKKEAMLEAKREAQKRKREEKMAAAAAAREAAERERQIAIEQAAKERMEKQAHASQGKLERLKEVERKKQELARKVAETEERRRVEERARQQRLAEEQKRAELARKKQCEEQEAMKKEAALMAKEIEKRQKEYLEKQRLKQKMEADKVQTPNKWTHTPSKATPEPVYMADGFEQLNSDTDEDETVKRPPPPVWSTPKARLKQLTIQAHMKESVIDRWFSVTVQSPDLRHIFPNIDRKALKRTSSAVWRTPPNRLATVDE